MSPCLSLLGRAATRGSRQRSSDDSKRADLTTIGSSGFRIDDYRWAIRRHGLQTSLGALKTIFDWKESRLTVAVAGFAAVTGGPILAAMAGGLGIAMQVGAWLTERRLDKKDFARGPNREVAILYDLQERFQSRITP